MENTFYVVNEIYKGNYNNFVILDFYTQNKDDFINYVKETLKLNIENDYDGSYRYINGYEMFKTDKNELLKYIYEYPINFTDRFRDKLKIKEDASYDMTIANYFCLLRDKLEYITNVKQGMLYDLIDINNKIVIKTEQGYFLDYLTHFIEDKYFDRGKLIRAFIESYTK